MFNELTIEGDAGALDRLIDDLTAHLGRGWSRDSNEEDRLNKTLDPEIGPRYAFRAPGGSAIVVLRRGGGRFTVVNIVPPEVGQLTEAQYNSTIDAFAEQCARPAAHRLGLTVSVSPDALPTRRLGSTEALKLLRAFACSGTAHTRHPLDKQRWFAFLIQAHLDGAHRDLPDIRRWLIEKANLPEKAIARLTRNTSSPSSCSRLTTLGSHDRPATQRQARPAGGQPSSSR